MTEATYRVVWRPFLGGAETLATGLTLDQAQAQLLTLPELPVINGLALGGSYGLEVEEPHPAGDARAWAAIAPTSRRARPGSATSRCRIAGSPEPLG
jgi:hypothetical protein